MCAQFIHLRSGTHMRLSLGSTSLRNDCHIARRSACREVPLKPGPRTCVCTQFSPPSSFSHNATNMLLADLTVMGYAQDPSSSHVPAVIAPGRPCPPGILYRLQRYPAVLHCLLILLLSMPSAPSLSALLRSPRKAVWSTRLMTPTNRPQ